MSILSNFINNLRDFFDDSSKIREIPNPNDYPGSLIFNYPFLTNEKGDFWVGSKHEHEAFIRYKEEKTKRMYSIMKENRRTMDSLSANVDNLLENMEKEARGEKIPEHNPSMPDNDIDGKPIIDDRLNIDTIEADIAESVTNKKSRPFSLN